MPTHRKAGHLPYGYNNTILYNDPYGDCPKCWNFVKNFVRGLVNAYLHNNTNVVGVDGKTPLVEGVKLQEPISRAESAGQIAGHAISVGQGVWEMGAGAGAAGGSATAGLATSPSGVGLLAGAAGTAGGLVISAHGMSTALNGLNNMLNIDDLLQGGDRLSDDRLQEAPKNRGDAPTGDDGHPVELHHRDQTPDGPIDEMTRTDHRGAGNYKKNHTNTGRKIKN